MKKSRLLLRRGSIIFYPSLFSTLIHKPISTEFWVIYHIDLTNIHICIWNIWLLHIRSNHNMILPSKIQTSMIFQVWLLLIFLWVSCCVKGYLLIILLCFFCHDGTTLSIFPIKRIIKFKVWIKRILKSKVWNFRHPHRCMGRNSISVQGYNTCGEDPLQWFCDCWWKLTLIPIQWIDYHSNSYPSVSRAQIWSIQ